MLIEVDKEMYKNLHRGFSEPIELKHRTYSITYYNTLYYIDVVLSYGIVQYTIYCPTVCSIEI